MTDMTPDRLADWEGDPNDWPHTPPLDVWTVLADRDSNFVWRVDSGHLINLLEAAIAALEAKTAEVEGYKQSYPCDGGCSYGDGPQEECSRHGRNPRELWSIITTAERERDEALAQLGNGSCWDEGPRLRTPDCGEQPGPLCELIAGHAGAHRNGTSEWMRNEKSYTQMRKERDEARAEVDDLAADPGHKAAKYWKWWQREKARADRAEDALERVKALHTKVAGCPWCEECGADYSEWPCATIRAIEGADDA